MGLIVETACKKHEYTPQFQLDCHDCWQATRMQSEHEYQKAERKKARATWHKHQFDGYVDFVCSVAGCRLTPKHKLREVLIDTDPMKGDPVAEVHFCCEHYRAVAGRNAC